MNIAMIEMVSSHGGMNYYDYGLLNGLVKLGNNVTLFTSENLCFDLGNNQSIKVSYTYKNLFKGNKIKKLLRYVVGTVKSLRQIKSEKTKVVHFQIFAISFLEVFVVWLLKLNRLKIVVTIHDVESFSKKNNERLSKYFYKKVNAIIVHNKASYDVLLNYLESIELYEIAINKCYIVHHGSYIGMLPNRIEKKDAKSKFDISDDTFVFLFFGQIKTVKGLDILLESFSKLVVNTTRKVKLIIAGKVWKSDWSFYEEIIKKNNLSKHIVLNIKYVPDEDVVYYYSAADCIVLPYKKIFQSGVLLMAQSYNTPVLVSNLLGMTEVVTDNENGFVFKSKSVESLYLKMKEIMECKDLEKIAKNAYDKLEKEYSWDEIAKLQMKIMEKVVSERNEK